MKTDVLIKECRSYDKPEIQRNISEIFNAFNDIVDPNTKVLIKPNMLIAEDPALGAITHPSIIEEVCRQIINKGAKPYIGDSSAFHTPYKVAQLSKLTDFTEKHNIPIINLTKKKKVNISYKNKKYWFYISRFADEADTIINLPKLKAHMQVRYTGAVKNMFGCVPGKIKALRHMTCNKNLDQFCKMIMLNYQLITPHLNIIDAVESLEEKGPRGGKVKKTNMIASSTNAIALDRVMTKICGLPESENPILQTAIKMGLCKNTTEDINIITDIKNYDADDFIWPKELDPIEFSPPRVLKSILKMMWLNAKHHLNTKTP